MLLAPSERLHNILQRQGRRRGRPLRMQILQLVLQLLKMVKRKHNQNLLQVLSLEIGKSIKKQANLFSGFKPKIIPDKRKGTPIWRALSLVKSILCCLMYSLSRVVDHEFVVTYQRDHVSNTVLHGVNHHDGQPQFVQSEASAMGRYAQHLRLQRCVAQ